MQIAVVILNWNGQELLREFLPSVIRYSINDSTIYVADNGSTDESISILKNEFPQVKIIELADNYGFAKGYNKALSQVEEDIYVILNSDVEVTQNWLNGIPAFFTQHPNAKVLQPSIVDYRNKDKFEYAGAAGGFIDRNGFVFCDGRIFNKLENFEEKEEKEIFWASGASMIIKKDAFRSVEGYDPDFFAHMEEIDLCWRIKNQGGEIWYYPNSKIYHLGGGTLGKLKPKKTYLNFRNNLFLLTKNYRQGPLFLKLFWRMVLDAAAAYKFLFEGSFAHFMAVAKAHFHFYLNFASMFKKRSALKKLDSNPNFKGIYLGNIVFDYFLKGKKKFSDLRSEKFS